jgi:hypothetical protein
MLRPIEPHHTYQMFSSAGLMPCYQRANPVIRALLGNWQAICLTIIKILVISPKCGFLFFGMKEIPVTKGSECFDSEAEKYGTTQGKVSNKQSRV